MAASSAPCTDARCNYQAPHVHGFDCDHGCNTCLAAEAFWKGFDR